MFQTASVKAIGCCPIGGKLTDCGFRVECIDMKQFKNGTFCDSGCVHDTYTLKWYASALTTRKSIH